MATRATSSTLSQSVLPNLPQTLVTQLPSTLLEQARAISVSSASSLQSLGLSNPQLARTHAPS
jgi:hypothetical protein